VEYFDVVPRALTLDLELSMGAKITWIAVRAFIQEGDRQDREKRSRRLYTWQLAAELDAPLRSVQRWLCELEDGKWIERINHRRGGVEIILLREHRKSYPAKW
jgi:hypothetical protein